MRVSYSRVDCWWTCPYQYKLNYIDKLKPKKDIDPRNALYEGTSIHEAIEKRSISEGLESYKSNYDELGPEHEFEMYKLEKAMDKAIKQIDYKGEYEYKILTDDFIGYIDMLIKNDDGTYSLLDFKFSNNVAGYKDSGQLHVYNYYYEKTTGNKVKDLYYVMVPKCPTKYSQDEDIDKLKKEVDDFYSKNNVRFEQVEFDRKKVNYFFARKTLMEKDKIFEKRYSFKCSWCPFQKYCASNGKDKSELEDSGEVKEVSLWS